MSTPVPLPKSLLLATSISWTPENNHGLVESPFSGITQAQRGRIQRWSFTMRLRRFTKSEGRQWQEFFLALDESIGLFTMYDPAHSRPAGKAFGGTPAVNGDASAGSGSIATDGWAANVAGLFLAGDWVQIGDHFAKITADVDSDSGGNATLPIWPKLYTDKPDDTAITIVEPRGIFRFISDLPSWEIETGRGAFPFTTALTGRQEVLTA